MGPLDALCRGCDDSRSTGVGHVEAPLGNPAGSAVKVCEHCHARFRGEPTKCPLDGAALTEAPDPRIGRTIGGRYVVESVIGQGGMGTVYQARQDVLDRRVAIKFLSPELAVDESQRQRFLREARAANRINHEHIIDITDYGETDDGLVYLVMEYLDGVPLDAEIEHGPLPVQRALRITLQAALALGRAHEFDIVHRDIKPDNIYLLRGYEQDFVKILDFGLAHMKGELRLTATGVVFGTPEYISPEQARGKNVTASADLYSLGCVLFEMLTGRLPFEGATTELILQHLREPPPPPSTYESSLPSQVDDLVLQLLAKDPAARPANAYELAEGVRSTLEHQFEQRPSSNPPSEARPSVRPFPGAQTPEALRASTEHDLARPPERGSGVVAGASRIGRPEDVWIRRASMFRQWMGEAYPRGDAPAWLSDAITSIEQQVEQLRALRDQLGDRASEASRQEQELREMRLRIGRAIDELARDEARVAQRAGEARQRLQQAVGELAATREPLLQSWRSLPRPPQDARDLTHEQVAPLKRAGELATTWIDAAHRIEQARQETTDLENQEQDLRFQIAQLKGRLASISAESDYDVGGLKAQTVELDRELERCTEALMEQAEPIVRHFMAFPQLRPKVLG